MGGTGILTAPLLPPNYTHVRQLVISRIGRPVHLATQTVLDALHVIKLYKRNDITDSIAYKEPRLMKEVRHESIVKVHDAGELPDGQIWVATEYLPDGSLERHSKRWARWSLQQKIAVIKNLLDALQHLHVVHGILHRDIKPNNILLAKAAKGRFRALLTDFGSASKMDVRGECRPSGGSIWYRAPELLRGKSATIQSEIYSCGRVLQELLGNTLYRKSSIAELTAIHSRGERPFAERLPLTVPDIFVDIMEKATAPDPANRYQSISDFLKALHRNMRFDVRHFTVPSGEIWLVHRPHRSITQTEEYRIELLLNAAKNRHELTFQHRILPSGVSRKIGRTLSGKTPRFHKAVANAIHKICCSPQNLDKHIDSLQDALAAIKK